MEHKFNCILCNSNNLSFYMVSRDNENKKIYNCLDCKMRLLFPRILNTEEVLEYGKVEYQDTIRITSDKDKLELTNDKELTNKNLILCNQILEKDCIRYIQHISDIIKKYNMDNLNLKMLDVGTGYGYFPYKLGNLYKNIEITGLDLNHNKLNFGKKTLGFDFNCIFNKIEDEQFIEDNKEKFDIITSWHVLEHVFDPILWTNNIMRLLKKDGFFILEVPNEDDELIDLVPEYSKLIHFQDHVNYFHKENIIQLMKKCNIDEANFKIYGVQRYGFYNYIDWIRYGTRSKVESDDYINLNNKPRNKLEEIWMNYRETNINSDTMYIVIQKK